MGTVKSKVHLTDQVEFISTSAAFHGVTSQLLTSLEEELLKVLLNPLAFVHIADLDASFLKVFPNNVMPANAAAWYMAKRKYYMNEPYDQQLLPFLLKKFPEKFRLLGKKVLFGQEIMLCHKLLSGDFP